MHLLAVLTNFLFYVNRVNYGDAAVTVVMLVMMMMMKTRCAVYIHCSFVLHLQAGTYKSKEGLANTILRM